MTPYIIIENIYKFWSAKIRELICKVDAEKVVILLSVAILIELARLQSDPSSLMYLREFSTINYISVV